MAGNGWTGWIWLEMAAHNLKWLEIAGMAENGWNWLEITGNGLNGRVWLEIAEILLILRGVLKKLEISCIFISFVIFIAGFSPILGAFRHFLPTFPVKFSTVKSCLRNKINIYKV